MIITKKLLSHQATVLFVVLTTCTWVSVSVAEPTVTWDEVVDGDLSNDFGKPTLFTISEPGELSLY